MTFDSEKVTAAYEEERKQNRTPVTINDIPFSFEVITPDWLTVVLCGNTPGAKVVSHRLDAADNGTSNRRRIFIAYNEAGKKAGLPERVFCKASQGLENRLLLGPSGSMQGEVNFYTKARPLLEIEAPRGYFANFNPDSLNSIVILDDMGDRATFCNHKTEITLQRAESQMRILAKFHARFLESHELGTSLAAFPTWPQVFGRMDSSQWADSCDRGFGAAEEVIPRRLFAQRKDIWPATRMSVERHLHLPHTLLHGDTHLRNWYIVPSGEMGLGDWQVTTQGHWSRDLIYAITTSLTVENRRQWGQELIRYHHDQLQQQSGRVLPFDGIFDETRRQLFTALAFWTCVIDPFTVAPNIQPNDATLEFIRRISTAIDDLDALNSFK